MIWQEAIPLLALSPSGHVKTTRRLIAAAWPCVRWGEDLTRRMQIRPYLHAHAQRAIRTMAHTRRGECRVCCCLCEALRNPCANFPHRKCIIYAHAQRAIRTMAHTRRGECRVCCCLCEALRNPCANFPHRKCIILHAHSGFPKRYAEDFFQPSPSQALCVSTAKHAIVS